MNKDQRSPDERLAEVFALLGDPEVLKRWHEAEKVYRALLHTPEGKKKLRDNINALRGAADCMSIRELARRANLSAAYIGKIIAGDAVPRIDVLATLAKVLGVKTSTLLTVDIAPQIQAVIKALDR